MLDNHEALVTARSAYAYAPFHLVRAGAGEDARVVLWDQPVSIMGPSKGEGPGFRSKPWACSMSQVDWAGEGYEGVKLAYPANCAGFFYDKHRAVNDCAAAIELLSLPLPSSKMSALSQLLAAARKPTWRIRAEGAPFELKDALKARGYRWDDGSAGSPRAWFIDVSDADRDAELRFLQREIYQREIDIHSIRIDAFDRFSDRC